jgi:hypothetical protein
MVVGIVEISGEGCFSLLGRQEAESKAGKGGYNLP